MIAFVLQRVVQALAVMLAVALVAFSLFRFVGDPVINMVGQDTPEEERIRIREQLALDQPVVVQYIRFVQQIVTGNFGTSLRTGIPIGQLMRERLPATLELAVVGAFFALLVGVPMGVFTGLYPRSGVSKLFLTISLIGVSLPTFLIGILLILFFSVLLGWLPSFGRGDVTDLGIWTTGLLSVSGWQSIIMPAVTLGMFQLALIMRLVRAEMLEVLRTDYIKFARARGLSNRAIHFGHALRNTLIPVITIVGLQLGALIAFSIITESVFQWPGMGLLFLQAVQFADIPVMAIYLVLIGFLFVVINLIVDLLYYVVDPRLRVDVKVGRGG